MCISRANSTNRAYPILPGCVANFQCLTEHAIDGGDHTIFVGRVTRMRHDTSRSPLLFHRGKYEAVLNSTGGGK